MKSPKKYYLLLMFVVLTAHTVILSIMLNSSNEKHINAAINNNPRFHHPQIIQTSFNNYFISKIDSTEFFKTYSIKNTINAKGVNNLAYINSIDYLSI